MARHGREKGRVKIQWIMDKKKRKTAMRRRLPALVKKAGELTALCDVPVCLVVYPPGEPEPVTWPSPGEAANVVREYKGLPRLVRFRNKLASTHFVKQMNGKVRVKLSQVELQRRDAEIKDVIADFVNGRRDNVDDLPIEFFISVGMKVHHRLQAIRARLKEIRPAPPLLRPPPPVRKDVKIVVHLPMVATTLLHNVGMTPMALDGEPRYGSYLFEVIDAINASGDGSALPSIEELYAVFLQAGIFSPPLPKPSSDP